MLKNKNIIVWGVLVLLSSIFYYNKILTPVKDRHAWALADHFAISLGFIDNNFDFFHPETKCLNPQFPAKKIGSENFSFWSHPIENPQGITAIDFPVHHYIIASIMHVLDTDQTYVFRLYMLLFSLIGLFYLYKLGMLITKNFYYSLFIVLFVFLSPTYSYYTINFLPTQASFSLLMIAGYQYLKHLQSKVNKHFYYCLTLLLVASLARLPFSIYLIGFLLIFILKGIFDKKIQWRKLLLTTTYLLIIFAYFLYNKYYLFQNFGSNFLNYPLPATNIKQFLYILWKTIFHESWRYFTIVHYVILGFVFALFIKNKSTLKHNKIYKSPILNLIICSGGVCLYMILMFQQFVAHDYYMMDTFLPILIFWMLILHQFVPQKTVKKLFIGLCIFGLLFNRMTYIYGYAERKIDPLEQTRKNFAHSEKILDSLDIKKSDRILLIDSYSPNLAFINMNRKGFVIMDVTFKNIQNGLKWNYDYIITQNFSYQSEILENYPNFENETKIIFSNDKFTIHTKK